MMLSNGTVSFDPTVPSYSFNLLSASRTDDLDPLQLQHSSPNYLTHDQTSRLPTSNTKRTKFFGEPCH